jgi:hypothetical protein
VNVTDVATPLAFSGSFGSVETTEPLQPVPLNSVYVTVPVGFGTPAGVPAVRVTVASSCTTVPGGIVVLPVTSVFDASSTLVETCEAAHSFVAGVEFAPTPFVDRVSDTPMTDTVVCALTIVVPAVDETSVIEQLPVPPDVVHGFAVVNDPGPDTIVNMIDVPSGAGTKPVPGFTFTCAVNT